LRLITASTFAIPQLGLRLTNGTNSCRWNTK